VSSPPRLSLTAAHELTLDTDPYLSCDDCFDQVDQVCENLLAGQTMPRAFVVHLRACPACLEEAESLVALLADEDGRDVAATVQHFEDLTLGTT
jgi:hypothetical protein